MRIIFMGSPDFAVPALRALHAEGHEIACVYTQPPRRAGRGKKLAATPVESAARALGLEVCCVKSFKSAEALADFAAVDADVAVVAAYGLILPQKVLDLPRHGCLNIHASLLPRWRGAAPIHRAIMAGDEETGVTIMQMEAGLDTGAMLARARTPIQTKTTGELTLELAELGADLMVKVLRDLSGHERVAQDEALASYAAKIDKREARVDWTRGAQELVRHIQALAPFPGAWCEIAGERVKLLRAERVEETGAPGEVLDAELTIACGKDALRPLLLQRAGKPVMARADFLRGFPIAKGPLSRARG